MRRTIFVAALAAAAIVALPASAAPPQTTTFSVVEQFSDPPTAGVFTSDGSIVCASGTTENAAFGSGFRSERGEIFHVRKTITCNDGSGTFTLLIQARIGFNVGNMTFGPWVVLSGTGDYVNLHGRGTVTGTQIPGGVSDLYVGCSPFDRARDVRSGGFSLKSPLYPAQRATAADAPSRPQRRYASPGPASGNVPLTGGGRPGR